MGASGAAASSALERRSATLRAAHPPPTPPLQGGELSEAPVLLHYRHCANVGGASALPPSLLAGRGRGWVRAAQPRALPFDGGARRFAPRTHPRPLPCREGRRRYVALAMQRRVPEVMTTRARELRQNATPAERMLWARLAPTRPRWTRQLVVGPFILDLACRSARLAVELDGGQHGEQLEYDGRRTDWLEARGWRVVRLWNSDVLAEPDAAATHVWRLAAECLGGTHPQPLPCREGDAEG